MNFIFLIPARGGSKGIPNKNTKRLDGKPLLHYSIELARNFVDDSRIIVSTDSSKIARCAEEVGLPVPFMRPEELATDTAGTYEVILHAREYCKNVGIEVDAFVLLQPTSPLRTVNQLKEILCVYNHNVDLVVSVVKSAHNPYFVSYQENDDGMLEPVLESSRLVRRQDCPDVYNVNGAFYVINSKSLGKYVSLPDFPKKIKYEMDSYTSIDIDEPLDWEICEYLIRKR